MYEMKSLEDDWKAYKKKKRKPFLISGMIIAIGIVSVMLLDKEKISLDKVTKYVSSFIDFKEEAVKVNSENIAQSLVVTKGFNKLATKEMLNSENNSDILVDIPILDSDNTLLSENLKNTSKVQLDIIGTSSVIAYEDVERRFEQNHDIDDALFLAKSYYKKGHYEKAAYWALETNKLDDDVEESIFIFVESKVKSGQVNEGLSILKKYINQSNSDEARKLLFRIENN